jgi:hypothetical protein
VSLFARRRQGDLNLKGMMKIEKPRFVAKPRGKFDVTVLMEAGQQHVRHECLDRPV